MSQLADRFAYRLAGLVWTVLYAQLSPSRPSGVTAATTFTTMPVDEPATSLTSPALAA